MKARPAALRNILYKHLSELAEECLAHTDGDALDGIEEARICLDIMEAIDSGQKRLVIDLTRKEKTP